MEAGSRWILYGLLFLLLALIIYFLGLTNQTFATAYTLFLTNIGFSIWLIMNGILMTRRYKNKSIYLIPTTIIALLVFILIYNQKVSPGYNGNNKYSYVWGGIFTLIIVGLTGDIIRRMGKYQDITKPYEKAFEINPNDTIALNNKGTQLAEFIEYKEAIKCFDKILKIDSNDSAAWHNKGVVLDKLGKHRDALMCYDKALKIDPGFKKSKTNNKIILES